MFDRAHQDRLSIIRHESVNSMEGWEGGTSQPWRPYERGRSGINGYEHGTNSKGRWWRAIAHEERVKIKMTAIS